MNIKFWIAICLCLCFWLWRARTQTKSVQSRVDKKFYRVRNLPDYQIAADMLANVKNKLSQLKLKPDPSKNKFKEIAEANTSYTVNKETIYLCLREGDKFVDENVLFFVALHELAHTVTESYHHTEEFWNNFRNLLRQAINKGLYRYQPYHTVPKEYCGICIDNTPLKMN